MSSVRMAQRAAGIVELNLVVEGETIVCLALQTGTYARAWYEVFRSQTFKPGDEVSAPSIATTLGTRYVRTCSQLGTLY